MSFVNYVPLDRAIAMVQAVNGATTQQEHQLAGAALRGYQKRCEETGQTWPCCDLDFHFGDGNSRPLCCGVFLDWAPL